MIRATITALATVIAVSGAALAPAAAAECDEATMMQVQGDIEGMTDPAMKDQMMAAEEEMKMAKAAMEANDATECAMHLDAAMKATMMDGDAMMDDSKGKM